jgi:hypothetical protein
LWRELFTFRSSCVMALQMLKSNPNFVTEFTKVLYLHTIASLLRCEIIKSRFSSRSSLQPPAAQPQPPNIHYQYSPACHVRKPYAEAEGDVGWITFSAPLPLSAQLKRLTANEPRHSRPARSPLPPSPDSMICAREGARGFVAGG